MVEVYTRINWVNKKDGKTTPLGASNLNKMDAALSEIDQRTVELDATKADKSTVNEMLADCSYDAERGIVCLTRKNGDQIIIDLNIEKIPVAFVLSEEGVLTMKTDDGTEWTADIGAMIPVLTFNSTDTISVAASGIGKNKTYAFSVKDGSITEEKLQPDYLADIKKEESKAAGSAKNAAESAGAAASAREAAEKSAAQAQKSANQAEAIVGMDVFVSNRGDLTAEEAAKAGLKSGCYGRDNNNSTAQNLLVCFRRGFGSATALQILAGWDNKWIKVRTEIDGGKYSEWRDLAYRDLLPTVMTGATATSAGKSGLVPEPPATGTVNRYLAATGQWQTLDASAVNCQGIAYTTYDPASGSYSSVNTGMGNQTLKKLIDVITSAIAQSVSDTAEEAAKKAKTEANSAYNRLNSHLYNDGSYNVWAEESADYCLIPYEGLITLRVVKISTNQLMAVHQYLYMYEYRMDTAAYVGKLVATTAALSDTYGAIAVSTADEAVKLTAKKGYYISASVMSTQ